MEKVIRDGKVAVLVSTGFGAGWYSWHSKKELLFHPKIVELVEKDSRNEITEELCRSLLGIDGYICCLGARDLVIHWLPVGTVFTIEEYDGDETLKTVEELDLIIA